MSDPICVDELQILYDNLGRPTGIRDRHGLLLSLLAATKYDKQEERYLRDLDKRKRLAVFLLAALEEKT